MNKEKEYQHNYYILHKEKLMQYKKEHYSHNRDMAKKRYEDHKDKLKDKMKVYHNLHRDKQNAYSREHWVKIRNKVLEHYGNKCVCCGETRNHFLTIDHINNNGAKHRREISVNGDGKNVNINSWLVKNNYPDGFQILCWNCNCAKGFYGVCPHQEEQLGIDK